MRAVLVVVVCLLAACGGGSPAPSSGTTPAAPARQIAALSEENATLEGQVRELEARLALSSAEARQLRERAEATPAPALTEVVRIGEPEAEEATTWDEPEEAWPPRVAEDRGPRPLLRLYGVPGEAPDSGIRDAGNVPPIPLEPLALPEPPPGVEARLPVATYGAPDTAFPVARVTEDPAAQRRSAPLAPAIESYRAALSLVRDRRYSEGRAAIDAWLAAHPSHPYAASAVYWRGEALYAEHQYAAARAEFERMVTSWPRAAKVADALFKIGMCHRRMGDHRRARVYFSRVRREHPESVAARLSAQEDST